MGCASEKAGFNRSAREVNKLMVEDFTEVEKILSKGFTEQEMKQFFDYMHRMQKNMKEATAR